MAFTPSWLNSGMRLLLVFLKEPTPGQVKTRLAADVGDSEAARFYKAMVEVQLKQLHGLNHTRIRFCYAPDDAGDAVRFWLLPKMNATAGTRDDLFLAPTSPFESETHQEVEFHAQGEGDLGMRLNRAFAQGFKDGFEEIAVIGTDCPDCGSRWINAAFARLTSSSDRHGVIGPCPDGGYYLLALNSHAPVLFSEIPWSSEQVLASTRSAAQKAGLHIEELPPLSDIDNLGNWQSLLNSPLGPAIKKVLGEK